ncbi:hypothetical protein J2X65_004897 [Ancylobacter sp. 3268]|uniref:hypothetical protein n=1 Tax=Ancylobacter sp. 3268 TaxID=2817752 RepID=UPI002863F2CC|nr:hypothetical protein [Ancylobacter sp. 3268]MDR6955517.1 hypothetical protein [Ancylobacter sp. 3268]
MPVSTHLSPDKAYPHTARIFDGIKEALAAGNVAARADDTIAATGSNFLGANILVGM